MKDFFGIMAWSDDDLKAFNKYVIQHNIELVEGVNPLEKKLKTSES